MGECDFNGEEKVRSKDFLVDGSRKSYGLKPCRITISSLR